MKELTATDLEYRHGSLSLRGYLATNAQKNERRPGVLVVHGAVGLNQHAKDQTRLLAELGYVALAVDLWGDGRVLSGIAEAREKVEQLTRDTDLWYGRLNAGLLALAAQPHVVPEKIAAVGYCFGGTTVLEFARQGAAIKGVVSMHGKLEPERAWMPGQCKAKVLICNGADDPLNPPANVVAFQEAMTKGGADWQVVNYGHAKHSFTFPDAKTLGMPQTSEYHKPTAERSWKAMRSFFDELFASPAG